MLKSLEQSISTPCPVLNDICGNGLNAPAFADDENTANVEFTAKFPRHTGNGRPRRRPSALSGQFQGTFTAGCSTTSSRSASSLLGVTLTGEDGSEGRLRAPRRMRPLPAPAKLQAKPTEEMQKERSARFGSEYRHDNASALRKNPRRRTIYIPSDDTTVMTIHPGLRAADANTDDTIRDAGHLSMIGDANAPMHQNRAKRRPSLMVGPRRAPLQPSLKPLQESTDRTDRVGASWDKENIPPGSSMPKVMKPTDQVTLKPKRWSVQRSNIGNEGQDIIQVFPSQKESIHQDYQNSSREPQSIPKTKTASSCPRPAEVSQNGQPCSSYMKRRNSIYYGLSRNDFRERDAVNKEEPFTERSVFQHSAVNGHKRYKVLEENIQTPELFEAAWLNDSELAVQQLLNRIFERKDGQLGHLDLRSPNLRHELLQLYTSPEIVLLYKRLQASLIYGALNPPNSSPFVKSNWASDLGLRRKYTSLLLDTYDSGTLKVATEVVVGRSQEPCLSFKPASTSEEKGFSSLQRNLKTFMEDCLVDNEDAHESRDQRSPLWCWRRTMLRSLMLILLLDKAKESSLISVNLFKPSSRFKTSHEVLLSLLALLSPSTGHRPLAQLSYKLEYIQPWSKEYVYEVKNLATDIRDGVKLTRLVEILLHSGGQSPASGGTAAEAEFSGYHSSNSWTLSQQLKMPCHCSTQKISNVQIALSALRGEQRLSMVLDDIRAEDIVHGHREKTITLLWTLVSKFGLDEIIDFRLVEREIRRLVSRCSIAKTALAEGQVQEKADFGSDAEKNVTLLKKWASTVAIYRGERIYNFTTAFSDGRIFNAIVDEYSKYVPGKHDGEGKVQSRSLTAKLKDVGCSHAFASIFENSGNGRIFDHDFVLAALAFLCSRLLIPARRGIAASVIGDAYKRMKSRRSIQQRLVLMRLAHDCKAVFEARTRIIDSARILQRAWRTYQEVKRTGRTGNRFGALEKPRKRMLDPAPNHTAEHVDIWLP